jgi:MraZ protein
MAKGFCGTFSSPLDEKNRAVLPARLRDAVEGERLRDGFKVTQGFEGCLLMFLRDHWRDITARIERLPFTSREARLFKRFFLSSALDVPIDRIGRIMIADLHRELGAIDREVIFNGMGSTIEIWSPAKWKSYRQENQARYEDVAATLPDDVWGSVAPFLENRGRAGDRGGAGGGEDGEKS